MVPRARLIIAIISCAFFMENLDSTIMVTALPKIAETFGTNVVRLSLSVTGYIVAFAVFIPFSGWLGDRFGSASVFRAALLIFIGSSVCCGLSSGLMELTVARVVQGLGAAMMVPVGRTIVVRSFDKSQMVQALAMIAIPALVGPLLGNPVGGFITTTFSWRWNFFINVPIGLTGFVLAWLFIPNHREDEARGLDWIGFVLIGISIGLIIYGLEMLERGGSAWKLSLAFLAGGGAIGAAAVRYELHTEAPLLDFTLLRIKTFHVSTIGSMGARFATGATPYLLPLLFQIGFGRTALASGLLTFATAMGVLVVRPWAKPILRRFGFRTVLVQNGFFAALTILLCAFLGPDTPAWLIILVLAAGGFFRSLGISTFTTLAYADIDSKKTSAATSFAMMMIQLGNAFGIAIGAVVLHLSQVFRGAAQLERADFRVTFICVAIISLFSIPFFASLAEDAGSEISGHRLPDRLPKSDK